MSARRFLDSAPASRIRPRLTEFVVFGLKQGGHQIFRLSAALEHGDRRRRRLCKLLYPPLHLGWVLLAAVAVIFARCVMHFRVFRVNHRMPLVVAFLLVALFIWIAENIATWSGARLYPSQVDGWQPVGLEKLVAWFLLMIISVVLVAWVYKPQPPEEVEATEPAAQGKVAY